jgi:hypothetical protein
VSHRKTRTRDANSGDDRVHELVDIIAEEVSDVDRAANRRRYLAIKRETDGDADGLGTELFDDELGDEDMDSEPDDASLAKARRSRAAADDEESEDEDDSEDEEDEGLFEDEESEDAEEEKESEDEDDSEDDRRRPRRGKARKETRVLSAKAKVALLRRTAPVLERLTKLVASIKDAAETQEGGAQGIPDWITRELQWICEALAEILGKSSKSATRPVNKLGAKMASQRREQLQGAIELLQRLLQEVMPEITAARAPAPTPPQPAPTAKAAKREPGTHGELGALLASMTEGISALTTQVKTQASELARLKKSTGLPASRPVESARRPQPPAPEEDWPFDMNAPLSRDRVAKEISFFEEP